MKSYGLDDNNSYLFTKSDEVSLKSFFQEEQLSLQQAEQCKSYLLDLLEWNKKFNLTALTRVKDIVLYHFQDSLKIRDFYDFSTVNGIADIGSGGGFPGIPLKICFPEIPMVLIEVNHKKIKFLEHIITTLKLEFIEVCPLDWRTFLRKTEYDANLFCARASLEPIELMRMFKPSCIYNKAELIYWASRHWRVGVKEKNFFKKEIPYTIGNKKRKFVFFGKPVT